MEAWQLKTKDPWMFRDGMSVLTMRDGFPNDKIVVPDRFDFEVDSPGNKDGKLYEVGS